MPFHIPFLLVACLLSAKGVHTSKFLGSDTVREVALSLNRSIEIVMGGYDLEQTASIERSIWQTFVALPKNALGRLEPPAVRYAMQSYFAKEHGWRLEGLEPHLAQGPVVDLNDAAVLREGAPFLLEMMLEDRRRGQGLSFEDVIVMIFCLERLILQSSVHLLRRAYALNNFSEHDTLSEEGLHEVLQSYLLLFRAGRAADNPTYAHLKVKAFHRNRNTTVWQEIEEFEGDELLNYAYATRRTTNFFIEQKYTFEAATNVLSAMARGYGKWQDASCRAMKDVLLSLDARRTGRVPLNVFYAQPETEDYSFVENLEYLESIGALENRTWLGPQVRIANYVAGPSNCVARTSYFSVCCVSECEAIINELEAKVQAPLAAPEHILRLVANISAFSNDAFTALSGLTLKLKGIAERHGGAVPLHGRLFAQWLHFVFPHECPYPQTGIGAALMGNTWGTEIPVASAEEKRVAVARVGTARVDEHHLELLWSDTEMLPLEHHAPPPIFSSMPSVLVQLALLLAALHAIKQIWSFAVLAHSTVTDKGNGWKKLDV